MISEKGCPNKIIFRHGVFAHCRGIPLKEKLLVSWFLDFLVAWFQSVLAAKFQRFTSSISCLLIDIDPLSKNFETVHFMFLEDIDVISKIFKKCEGGSS